MSKAPQRKESPKGLIAFTREEVKWGEHGFEIEETAPGTFVGKGPAPREMIRSLMGALKEKADETITAAGKDPAQWPRIKRESDHADPAYVAARLLDELWSIQNAVNAVARAKDASTAKSHAYDAVQKALAACFTYHALSVVEHEVGIVVRQMQREGGAVGGRERGKNKAARNAAWAEQYLERRERSTISDTQLKRQITGLSKSAAHEAIKKGLAALEKRVNKNCPV